jgi:hypothetical protein
VAQRLCFDTAARPADFEADLSNNLYISGTRLSSGRYSESERRYSHVGHSNGRRPHRQEVARRYLEPVFHTGRPICHRCHPSSPSAVRSLSSLQTRSISAPRTPTRPKPATTGISRPGQTGVAPFVARAAPRVAHGTRVAPKRDCAMARYGSPSRRPSSARSVRASLLRRCTVKRSGGPIWRMVGCSRREGCSVNTSAGRGSEKCMSDR